MAVAVIAHRVIGASPLELEIGIVRNKLIANDFVQTPKHVMLRHMTLAAVVAEDMPHIAAVNFLSRCILAASDGVLDAYNRIANFTSTHEYRRNAAFAVLAEQEHVDFMVNAGILWGG